MGASRAPEGNTLQVVADVTRDVVGKSWGSYRSWGAHWSRCSWSPRRPWGTYNSIKASRQTWCSRGSWRSWGPSQTSHTSVTHETENSFCDLSRVNGVTSTSRRSRGSWGSRRTFKESSHIISLHDRDDIVGRDSSWFSRGSRGPSTLTLNVAEDSIGDVIRSLSWEAWSSWSTRGTRSPWRARSTSTLTVGRCWCPGGPRRTWGSWRSRQILPDTITLK